MKRWIALCLALALAVSLAACGGAASSAAQEKDYARILMDARSDEDNQYLEIVAGKAGQDPSMPHNPNSMDEENIRSAAEMMFTTLGLDSAALDGYAFSMSLMNVRAYAVGIFKPAEGREEEVQQALQAYVTAQQRAFENYLPDQYEVAKAAVLRTAASGEIVLVLCENAADLASAIETALK